MSCATMAYVQHARERDDAKCTIEGHTLFDVHLGSCRYFVRFEYIELCLTDAS